jgi:hypothetical protein
MDLPPASSSSGESSSNNNAMNNGMYYGFQYEAYEDYYAEDFRLVSLHRSLLLFVALLPLLFYRCWM